MITKASQKARNGTIPVTFWPPAEFAGPGSVVGDFNGWDTGRHRLLQTADGHWYASVGLKPGKYRFRYFIEPGQWFNDSTADSYVVNEFGGADGVLRVSSHSDSGDSWAACRVRLRGDLDSSTAIAVDEQIHEMIESGARLMVINLGGVEFLDSSGLRVLIRAKQTLAQYNGLLYVEGASGAVRRALEVTGMIDGYRRSSVGDDG